MTTEQQPIRRLASGAIDTAYYCNRARGLRAEAAHGALRRMSVAITVVSVGALLGLLLPLTNNYDNPVILLLPWQIAVAAALGLALIPGAKLLPSRRRTLAVDH